MASGKRAGKRETEMKNLRIEERKIKNSLSLYINVEMNWKCLVSVLVTWLTPTHRYKHTHRHVTSSAFIRAVLAHELH